MIDIAPQQAGDWRRRQEAHALAAVVAAGQAGLASVAGDVGLDGDAVAGLEARDGGVGGEDHAGGFMAENVGGFDNHGADAPGMPEVNI